MMNHFRFNLKNRKLAAVAAGFLVLGIIGHSAELDAGDSAVVNIYVDGEKQSVTTNAATVGEVLDRAGVELSEHDLVEPALDAEISNQVFNINIYRSVPVLIVDGDDDYKIQSPYGSARLIVEESGVVELYEEDVVEGHLIEEFLQVGHIGYRAEIHRAVPLDLEMGERTTTVRTQADTVGGMFEEKGIDIGNNDIVEPSLETPVSEGMHVSLVQVGFESITEEVELEPETEQIMDNNQPAGYEEVEDEGRPGLAIITYEIEYRDGEEVDRKEVSRVVEQKPEPRVIVIGNQNNFSGDTDQILSILRECESGGRYDTNTGNGFYGAYQFMIDTWDRVAPQVGRPDLVGVRPDLASPADQDFMVVENARLSRGGLHSQHPGCSEQHNLPLRP